MLDRGSAKPSHQSQAFRTGCGGSGSGGSGGSSGSIVADLEGLIIHVDEDGRPTMLDQITHGSVDSLHSGSGLVLSDLAFA